MLESGCDLRLNIALLHHPVLDCRGRVVTTAVTNVDVHDIARTARTFGVDRYYVVTPVTAQKALVARLAGHWTEGEGASRNPNRSEALALVEIAGSLDDVVSRIEQRHGRRPVTVGTSAREGGGAVSFAWMRSRMSVSRGPFLLVFGTGWGMVPEVMDRLDHRLEPVRGVGEFNHLSVRSAAAVVLDRLLGSR